MLASPGADLVGVSTAVIAVVTPSSFVFNPFYQKPVFYIGFWIWIEPSFQYNRILACRYAVLLVIAAVAKTDISMTGKLEGESWVSKTSRRMIVIGDMPHLLPEPHFRRAVRITNVEHIGEALTTVAASMMSSRSRNRKCVLTVSALNLYEAFVFDITQVVGLVGIAPACRLRKIHVASADAVCKTWI